MAKISALARNRFEDKVKEYTKRLQESLDTEKKYLSHLNSLSAQKQALLKLKLADENMNMVSYHLIQFSLSVSILGARNETYLNNARKTCYKSLTYLEDVVSAYIDVPYRDYEDKLNLISHVSTKDRLYLVRKLGFTIDSVKEAHGEHTKWKWNFVELEARLAAISKNFMVLKNLVGGLDPRNTDYDHLLDHLNITRKMLQEAADKYRAKYETNHKIGDFQFALKYLSALKRLSILLGRTSDVEVLKKKIDVWQTKLKKDIQIEEARRKKELLNPKKK